METTSKPIPCFRHFLFIASLFAVFVAGIGVGGYLNGSRPDKGVPKVDVLVPAEQPAGPAEDMEIYVKQVVGDDVLGMAYSREHVGKMIFVEGVGKSVVDGDFWAGKVGATGTYTYTTVTGASAKVLSFKALEKGGVGRSPGAAKGARH